MDYFQSIPIGPWEPDGPAFLHLVGRWLRSREGLAAAQAELRSIAGEINKIGARTRIPNYCLDASLLQDDDVRPVPILNPAWRAMGIDSLGAEQEDRGADPCREPCPGRCCRHPIRRMVLKFFALLRSLERPDSPPQEDWPETTGNGQKMNRTVMRIERPPFQAMG